MSTGYDSSLSNKKAQFLPGPLLSPKDRNWNEEYQILCWNQENNPEE
jgi:hypothetical protein